MTGGVTTWNDPVIAADNPGVTLPATPVHPVIRSDLAGTNFVLQEYCIHEQPALWSDFVTSPIVVDNPAQVGDLERDRPPFGLAAVSRRCRGVGFRLSRG